MHFTITTTGHSHPQLAENDGLPAQICASCVSQAKTAFFFKQKCEESDKILRESLQVGYVSNGCDQLLILDPSSNVVKEELELDELGGLHVPEEVANEFVEMFGDGS